MPTGLERMQWIRGLERAQGGEAKRRTKQNRESALHKSITEFMCAPADAPHAVDRAAPKLGLLAERNSFETVVYI